MAETLQTGAGDEPAQTATAGEMGSPHAPRRCRALNAHGNPCENFSVGANGLCVAHDPDRADEFAELERRRHEGVLRAAEERRVTKANDPQPPPDLLHTIAGIEAHAAWTTLAHQAGRIDRRDAETTFKGLSLLQRVLDKRKLEAEIKQLRAQVDALMKARR